MFDRITICHGLALLNYVRKFRPTNFVWLINYVGRFLDLWLWPLLFISNFVSLYWIMFAMFLELCSASKLGPLEKKLTGSLGRSKFPALSITLTIHYSSRGASETPERIPHALPHSRLHLGWDGGGSCQLVIHCEFRSSCLRKEASDWKPTETSEENTSCELCLQARLHS